MAHRTMSFDEWFDEFRPIDNPYNPDSQMFETFGDEVEMVQNANPGAVWTLLDVDGKLIIGEGFHYVNRIGYYITEVVRTNETDTYEIIDEDADELEDNLDEE